MLSNQESGDIRVADTTYCWVIDDGHVPLVEVLVVGNDGVLLPNVAQKASGFLVGNHVGGVETCPIERWIQDVP